jgi:hypothetical protein
MCIQFIDDSVFQNSFVTENPTCSKDSIHQDHIHFALSPTLHEFTFQSYSVISSKDLNNDLLTSF